MESKFIGINRPVLDMKNIINKTEINVRTIEFNPKSAIRIPEPEQ